MSKTKTDNLYNTGMMHLNAGHYMTALPFFKEASERGDNKAQREIGMMYIMGLGVRADYDEGMKWIHKSAENGNHNAQYILGCASENDGNYSEAEKWYKKAEFGGSIRASEALNRMKESEKISLSEGLVDFNDKRKELLGKASKWALRERERMGMRAEHIMIAPDNTIVDYWEKDRSIVSLFYDENDIVVLRRDWPEDLIVRYNTVDNYKQLRMLAPDVVRDWENNAIKIYEYYDGPKGGITRKTWKRWKNEPSLMDKEHINNEEAEHIMPDEDTKVLSLDYPMKEAFEWAVSEQLRLEIVMEAVNDKTNYSKLDHSRIDCIISLFYDNETGRAILRNDYLYDAAYQYFFILNCDEIRQNYPKAFDYLTKNAIKIYKMYDGPHGGTSREISKSIWSNWFTPGVDLK